MVQECLSIQKDRLSLEVQKVLLNLKNQEVLEGQVVQKDLEVH